MRNFRKKNNRFAQKPDEGKVYRINEQIEVEEVRVIDGLTNEMIGIMATAEAIRMAVERDADLVEINPKAVPPVCKIIEWTKFRYQQDKNAHKPKVREDKTVRVNVSTDNNMLRVNGVKIDGFLTKGHRVKLQVQMMGREKAYPEIAREILEKLMSFISVPYSLESDISHTENSYFATIKHKGGGVKKSNKSETSEKTEEE